MAANKGPAGKKLGPPYGVVKKQIIGAVTLVVRCIFARTDYFHWRIVATNRPEVLELIEVQRGGLLKSGDAPSLKQAEADAKKWLAAHPKAQIG